MKTAHVNCVALRYSYQDTHNRAYYMVLAGSRWLGIRLDLLSALLIGAVALLAALYSHNNGKEMIYKALFISLHCLHVCNEHNSIPYSGVARKGRLESYCIILVRFFSSKLQCDLHDDGFKYFFVFDVELKLRG